MENNGHDPIGDAAIESAALRDFPGGHGVLGQQGPDITMARKEYNSVLQRAMSSIIDDSDYRQALGLARWLNDEDWQNWCNAFQECKRYGVDTGFLIDRLIAKSAGVDGGKLKAIFETISHTTFTTNYMGQQQSRFKRWFGRNNGNNTNALPR